MRKALVTGATGFIGKYVVRELIKNNVEVIAVVRENTARRDVLNGLGVRIVECNLKQIERIKDLVKDRDIDIVYHFAWQGISDDDIKSQDIQIQNIESTLNLIKTANDMGIKRFIGAGSLHEIESFYDMKKNKRITNLGYMYKAAKIAAHYMGKALAGSLGIDFFWPIVSNAYGAGEKSGRLINTIIRKVLNGETPSLSSGEQLYDFVYITDVASAFYLIGDKGKDGSNYIIGSGGAKKLKEFLRVVGELTDPNISLGFGEITSDNVVFLPEEVFDISNLTEDTGYYPKISFLEGINKTIDWIRNNEINEL